MAIHLIFYLQKVRVSVDPILLCVALAFLLTVLAWIIGYKLHVSFKVEQKNKLDLFLDVLSPACEIGCLVSFIIQSCFEVHGFLHVPFIQYIIHLFTILAPLLFCVGTQTFKLYCLLPSSHIHPPCFLLRKKPNQIKKLFES